MKKLTDKDAEAILKSRPARRYIQSPADGTVRVTFDSEIFVTKKGEEDILGFVWDKDWDKAEARVLIDGEPKIYSLGGTEFSFLADFISVCKKNNIALEDLPGCVFDITKTGDWTQDIKFVGRVDTSGKISSNDIDIKNEVLDAVKDAIDNLKKYSADLITNVSLDEFVTALSIKSRMKANDIREILPELEKEKLITIKDDKVVVH